MFSKLFSRKNKENIKMDNVQTEQDILKKSYLDFVENKKKQIELRVGLKNNLQAMQMEMFKKNNNLVSPKEILFSGNENLYVSVPSIIGVSQLCRVRKGFEYINLREIVFGFCGEDSIYRLGDENSYSEDDIDGGLRFKKYPIDGIEAMFLSNGIQSMDKMELIWVNLDLIKSRIGV